MLWRAGIVVRERRPCAAAESGSDGISLAFCMFFGVWDGFLMIFGWMKHGSYGMLERFLSDLEIKEGFMGDLMGGLKGIMRLVRDS